MDYELRGWFLNLGDLMQSSTAFVMALYILGVISACYVSLAPIGGVASSLFLLLL